MWVQVVEGKYFINEDFTNAKKSLEYESIFSITSTFLKWGTHSILNKEKKILEG